MTDLTGLALQVGATRAFFCTIVKNRHQTKKDINKTDLINMILLNSKYNLKDKPFFMEVIDWLLGLYV